MQRKVIKVNQVQKEPQINNTPTNEKALTEQIITNYLNRLKNPFVNLSVRDCI